MLICLHISYIIITFANKLINNNIMTKELEDYANSIKKVTEAIRKHKALAAWGNVESKERLKELRARKKELVAAARAIVK
jgi:hypothetical protein